MSIKSKIKHSTYIMFYSIESVQENMKNFRIHKAMYCSNTQSNVGNVVPIVERIMDDYLQNGTKVVVSNSLFTDTDPGFIKNLYIELQNVITNKIYKYNFCEGSLLDFDIILNDINSSISSDSLKIDVSIGEVVDKYSILELKLSKIIDESKTECVRHEMSLLKPCIEFVKNTELYKLLLYINELIWNDTELVKSIIKTYDETNFEQVSMNAKISNRIFDNNQKRFRIKKLLNKIYSSNVKEHKSYAEELCYIKAIDSDIIYNKIPEIHYLCITYDMVFVNIQHKDLLQSLFSNYNIYFIEDEIDSSSLTVYDLSTYSIDSDIRNVFNFEPITYISGGRFGDFLNQLSVICEKYYKTGKKGILYIANIGDTFVFGLDHTYKDTYSIIMSQPYIADYKIYNGENVNINLIDWRNNIPLTNWKHIYSPTYGVDWGKHRWINYFVTEEHWKDKIIINTNLSVKYLTQCAIEQLKTHIESSLDNCVFVSNEKENYNEFCSITGLSIEHYVPANFTEIVTIVNSCHMLYLGFSSMAVVANALHKPHYLFGDPGCPYEFNNMVGEFPHVLGMFV